MSASRSFSWSEGWNINPCEWKQEGECYAKFCFKTIYRITNVKGWSNFIRNLSEWRILHFFFFCFFFFLRFFERWKRVFQRNWCWFLSRRGMELKIYIFSCLYHANILILFGYRRYEKKNDGKIRNFLIKYHKK